MSAASDVEKFVKNCIEDVRTNEKKCNFLKSDIIKVLYEHIRHNCDKTLLETRTKEIVENVEEIFKSVRDDSPELLLYNFLEDIFNRTNQIERQYYFDQFLDTFYQISQEKNGPSKYLNQGNFENLVKTFLPYIKLKLVNSQLQEQGTTSESALAELIECIRCPKLLREDCYQIVKNEIETSKYELISFELIPIGASGFLGSYYKLDIRIKQEDSEKTYKFFAKFVLVADGVLEAMSFETCKKEIFFYKVFMSKLKSIGAGDLLTFAPKHYFSRIQDVIVLEDMASRGYSIGDPKVPVSYDCLKLITKKMSELHACSLIFDAKISSKTGNTIKDLYPKYFDEIIFHNTKPPVGYCAAKAVKEYLIEKFSDIPCKLPLQEIKKRLSDEIEIFFTKFVPHEEYINVVCQRDMWCGNILLRNIEDCAFVDYQMITYSPPAVDLLYMLYLNTDRETRIKHMDEIINLYYTSLKEILSKYGLDLTKLCPHDTYWKMIEEFKIVQLIQALCVLQVVICPIAQEIGKDKERAQFFYTVDRSVELEIAFRNFDWYRIRMRELVEDLLQLVENKKN